MAEPKRRAVRKKKAPEARGLAPGELASIRPPGSVDRVVAAVEAAGGTALCSFREPLGGHWEVLAALPIDRVDPTPYQRDLSPTHVTRLSGAIDRLGRYVDPIVAVVAPDGRFWTPNGHHRLAAMRSLGARTIVALVMSDPAVAHRILVLNTEKAHNVRERSLEVIRLAEALAGLDDRPERDYDVEFEEPSLLTLGLCYQRNGRFSGGAYQPVLKRTEAFSGHRLSRALEERQARAERLLALDEAVSAAVSRLKERGFESPYLKAFVIARINPLRFKRGATADPDDIIAKMTAAAAKFDPSKVKADQIAATGGAPEE